MKNPKQGFGLIELLVVIALVAILSGVLVPRVNGHIKAARDGRRLADVKILQNAIEQYHADRGVYPQPHKNPNFGDWDVSSDGGFLEVLVDEGYLHETPHDPIDDATYHYRYYVYEPGALGCASTGEFFVLGIRNFETSAYAARHKGFFRCPERDFGSEFAYVTGGGAGLER